LDSFGLGKQAMAPFQDRFLGQVQFAGQVGACLTLEHATQQQDELGGQQLTALEDRPAVERVDALALSAAINRQSTAAIGTKDPRVDQAGLTMRTAKAVWMEVLLDPRNTGVGIE
jgi:hypothetical protein